MSELCQDIPLGAVRIGKLMVVDERGVPVYDITNGNEYYNFGSVVGPVKNEKMLDLETETEFEILPLDSNGNLILKDVVPYRLYVISIESTHKIIGTYKFPYKLKETINNKSHILKRLVEILKERRTPHVTDKNNLEKIKERFPNEFSKIFSIAVFKKNLLKQLKNLKKDLVGCINALIDAGRASNEVSCQILQDIFKSDNESDIQKQKKLNNNG